VFFSLKNLKNFFFLRTNFPALAVCVTLCVPVVHSGGSAQSEESCSPGGGGGPLQLIVSLLTASPLSLDLSAHVDMLQLAGTLFAGLLYTLWSFFTRWCINAVTVLWGYLILTFFHCLWILAPMSPCFN